MGSLKSGSLVVRDSKCDGEKCDYYVLGINTHRIRCVLFCFSPKLITVPPYASFVDRSVLSNISKTSISIPSDNLNFVVQSYSISDSSTAKLIQCFGNESHVIIPRHGQSLCSSCSALYNSLDLPIVQRPY
jgi:hypothetical protein